MESMGKELIQLCDQLEQYGLVDYQMGVWEEEILCGEHDSHQANASTNTTSPGPMPRSDGEQTRAPPYPNSP